MEITKIFIITFFAALVGVIPPGLVNMSVAKTCMERGVRNGTWVAVGASTVVLVQSWIAIQLARYIFTSDYVNKILLRTGVVIFLIMAIFFFVQARKKRKEIRATEPAGTKSFFKGVMVSALNVLPIPYFCALAGGLNINGQVTYSVLNILVFIFAATLGTFATLYVYVISFAKVVHKTATISKYSNYLMAWLMMILLVITLLRILFINT